MRLIDAEALWTKLLQVSTEEELRSKYDVVEGIDKTLHCISMAPTIEAYTGAEYMHLLKLAKKMHTWIFLHTVNEDEVYKELGLTDEDNVLLGSLGKVELVSKADKFNHIADIGKKEGE